MFGNTGQFLPPRSVAPRIRGAKLRRRQTPAEPVPAAKPAEEDEASGVLTDSETAPGEVDSPSDSESDDETSTVSPGQAPATTQAPALDRSKTSERVIPTLTPITHAPRPIPPIFAGEGRQKGDKEITRTRSSSLAFPTELPDTDDEGKTRPGGVGAGLQPSPTSETTAVVTGSKGLIENGDGDDVSVVQNPPARGGLSAGAKAGIAVGTIAGVALLAGLLFFLWRWKRSRKGLRLADDPPELPYSSPNNLNPGLSATVDPRSNSQILDDLIAASYAHQNGNAAPGAAGGGWSAQDEKRDMEAANIGNIVPQSRQIGDPQPQIRFSIASWLRRHHPLKLNPLGSKRGSMASSAAFSNVSRAKSSRSRANPPAPPTVRDSSGSSILDVKTMMRPRYHDSVRPDQSVSQRNTFATEVTNSVYDYYARPESQTQGDVIPPLPPVITAPGQTKTQQLAAKYQSVWSDSTGTTTSGTSGASGITASSGAIPLGAPPNMGARNVDSVWTDQSGGTSVLYMYENAASSGQRPTTGLTNITTGSSAYPAPLAKREDPMPVSPLSPVAHGAMNGAGYGMNGRGSSPVLPPGNGGSSYS